MKLSGLRSITSMIEEGARVKVQDVGNSSKKSVK